jgi:hypothetical protein
MNRAFGKLGQGSGEIHDAEPFTTSVVCCAGPGMMKSEQVRSVNSGLSYRVQNAVEEITIIVQRLQGDIGGNRSGKFRGLAKWG